MLKIAVVDSSADSRQRIVDQLTSFLNPQFTESALLPRVSVKPISPQELKFHGAPDLLVVGDQLLQNDIVELSKIRRLLPHTPILARVTKGWGGISVIEQLARMGADDILAEDSNPEEFLRKLILLARKGSRSSSGCLIVVDSGKGGVGVTSVAAGLAECLWSKGKKTLLVDFDSETQDLSRFLQTKPFINEGLKLLFSEERPVSEDFVKQCLLPVWQDQVDFYCMPPAANLDEVIGANPRASRCLVSLLETLDEIFDCVVVDIGSVRGSMRQTLYRAADKIVYVVANDPACLFACAEGIRRIRPNLSIGSQLIVIENGSSRAGLASSVLRSEFLRATAIEGNHWCAEGIPFCKHGARWPASGGTIYSQSKSALKRAFDKIALQLGLVAEAESQLSITKFTAKFMGKSENREGKKDQQMLLQNFDEALQIGAATRQALALPPARETGSVAHPGAGNAEVFNLNFKQSKDSSNELTSSDDSVKLGRFVSKANWG